MKPPLATLLETPRGPTSPGGPAGPKTALCPLPSHLQWTRRGERVFVFKRRKLTTPPICLHRKTHLLHLHISRSLPMIKPRSISGPTVHCLLQRPRITRGDPPDTGTHFLFVTETNFLPSVPLRTRWKSFRVTLAGLDDMGPGEGGEGGTHKLRLAAAIKPGSSTEGEGEARCDTVIRTSGNRGLTPAKPAHNCSGP